MKYFGFGCYFYKFQNSEFPKWEDAFTARFGSHHEPGIESGIKNEDGRASLQVILEFEGRSYRKRFKPCLGAKPSEQKSRD
jgi:hypothetical protein